MADNRQIRVGAGLEESKYNEDFIDWLRKWGVPILLVVAIVAAAYGLRDRFRRSQEAKLDQSFTELESVVSGANPSPDSLLQIASDHAGAGSAVAAIARLEAADAYLDSVRRGVRPGATVKPEGELEKPEDALKPEEKAGYLTKAGDLYAEVYNDLRNDAGKRVIAIGALYGMAAVAEDQNDLAKAKGHYEEIIKLADAAGLTAHADVAKERIAKLDELKNVTPPLARADLPPVPEAPKPPPAPTLTPVDPSQLPPGLQPQPMPAPQPAQTDPLRQPTNPAPAPTTNPEQPAPSPANPPADPAPANPQSPPAGPTTPPAQPSTPPAPQPESPPAPK